MVVLPFFFFWPEYFSTLHRLIRREGRDFQIFAGFCVSFPVDQKKEEENGLWRTADAIRDK